MYEYTLTNMYMYVNLNHFGLYTVYMYVHSQDTSCTTDPVAVCLRALQQHPDLQGRYFTDFTYHVLKLDIVNSPLSGEIIEVVFADIHKLEPVMRMVYLLVYTMFNKLDLASITVLLRPLEAIFSVSEHTPHAFSPPGVSDAKLLVDAIQATKHPFGDPLRLSQFVISALFSSLVGSVFPQQKKITESECKMMCVITSIIYNSHVYICFWI